LGTIRREDRQRNEYKGTADSKEPGENKNVQPEKNNNMMSPPSRSGGSNTGPVNKPDRK